MTTKEMKPRTETVSVKTIRKHCLECSGDSAKCVLWCPTAECPFWASRFGTRPQSFIDRHGPFLLIPEVMPASSVNLDELPTSIAMATEWLQERHPEIEWAGPRKQTPEEIERNKQKAARMRAGRRGREIDSGADFPYENKGNLPRKAK